MNNGDKCRGVWHRSGRGNSPRRGYTLVELIVAMGSATLLIVGMASSVFLANQAMKSDAGASGQRNDASFTQRDVLADLQMAMSFSERTATAATFTVPDRTGDGQPETIRYAWAGSGSALTYSLNGATAVTVLANVQSFAFTYQTTTVKGVVLPDEETGPKVLLVVTDAGSPTADETARKTLLEAAGFQVVYAGQKEIDDIIKTESPVAIYISGTTDESAVAASSISTTTIGVVNEHAALADDFGIAKATSTTSASQLSVVNNNHYVTSSLPLSAVSVTSSTVSMTTLEGLASAARTLATVSSGGIVVDYAVEGGAIEAPIYEIGLDSTPALMTLNTGAARYDSGNSPGRRVMIPWGIGSFDPDSLTADGQLITRQAVEWAAGIGNSPPVQKTIGYTTILASSGDSMNGKQVATRVSLTEAGTLKSLSMYIGSRNDKVRYAVYADSSGAPGSLIVQTANGNSSSTAAWLTLTVADTVLQPGTYWLTFAPAHSNQTYRYASLSGASTRVGDGDATTSAGYSSTWGRNRATTATAVSIYGTYMAGGD